MPKPSKIFTAEEQTQATMQTNSLPESWDQFKPHAEQHAAYRDTRRFVGLFAGRGSGKTALAKKRLVRYLYVKKPWRDPRYGFVAPTLDQGRRLAWEDFKQLIPRKDIQSINETRMQILTVYGSTLQVFSGDHPERLEGVQYDGMVVDEICDQRPELITKSILPALTHRKAWLWRIGVPKRAGIGAKAAKEFHDKYIDNQDSEHVAYLCVSGSVLSPEELQVFRENMSEADFNESFRARWEDTGGTIFYNFDTILNVNKVCRYLPDRPIVVGCDFNVNPMSWALGHKICGPDGTMGLMIFDEVFIRNTNTIATMDDLARRYGNHGSGWEFFGDASSKARKTSSTSTDYIQIKNYPRLKHKTVFFRDKNPRILDRFAACNALFKNIDGKRRFFVHPRCEKLIADLEIRQYKEGTREADDYGDIGHITDAVGYLIEYLFPVLLHNNSVHEILTSM